MVTWEGGPERGRGVEGGLPLRPRPGAERHDDQGSGTADEGCLDLRFASKQWGRTWPAQMALLNRARERLDSLGERLRRTRPGSKRHERTAEAYRRYLRAVCQFARGPADFLDVMLGNCARVR
ncbi:MAG: hypothetical protein QME96_14385 [Myxococcota bacterium]|nr:hypothetical protein [Myxococcota bacterium]